MNDIKILLVDDQNLIAQSIKNTLQAAEDITVAAVVNSGEEVLGALNIKGLKLILLDIELATDTELDLNIKSGLDIATQIRVSHPDLKILFLTMFANKSNYVCRAIGPEINADGICSKNVSSEKLIEMIRKICNENGKAYSDEVLRIIPKCSQKKMQLTEREQKVACLTAKGFNVNEISEKLNIGTSTVERHRTHIYLKTNTSNLAEVTAHVISEKICEGLSIDVD